MGGGTKKWFLALVIFGLVWLGLRWLLPLTAPFVLGLGLALTAEPVVSVLRKRLHLPRSLSTGIGVSMTVAFLGLLVLVFCAFLARELRALAGALPDVEAAAESGMSMLRGRLLDMVSRTPQSIRPVLQENVSGLFSGGAAWLDKAVGYLLGWAGSLLSQVPDRALGLGTTVISGYMLSAKLPGIRRWLLRRIPKERLRMLLATGKRMKAVLLSWLKAQTKLMGVTFVIVFLGLVILRVPYALVWAVGISLVDAFPVLGTGTVMLPWSLVCLLQGDTARAVGLAGIYATVSLVRSVLEPKLLGRHLGLDPLVTLVALYVGYKLWGIGGMLLAPLLAVVAIQTIPERKKEEK